MQPEILQLQSNFDSHIAPLLLHTDTSVSAQELSKRIAEIDALSLDLPEGEMGISSRGEALAIAAVWIDEHATALFPGSGEEAPASVFAALVPRIFECAHRLPDVIKAGVPLLRSESSGSTMPKMVSVSADHILVLMCTGFLCCPPAPPRKSRAETERCSKQRLFDDGQQFFTFSDLSFRRLHDGTPTIIAAQKLICYLLYFVQSLLLKDADEVRSKRRVTFSRVSAPVRQLTVPAQQDEQEQTDQLPSVDLSCTREMQHVAREMIGKDDDVCCTLIFGNEQPGYCQIPSVTQEELMCILRPELTVAMLICETMAENEAVAVAGALPFVTSSEGYGERFRVLPPNKRNGLIAHENNEIHIFADAVVLADFDSQFRPNIIARDWTKLVAGLTAARSLMGGDREVGRRMILNTGKWGSGVFGASPELKLFIQLIAASTFCKTTTSCPVQLCYAAFKDEAVYSSIKLMLTHLARRKASVCELIEYVLSFRPQKQPAFRAAALKWSGATEQEMQEVDALFAKQLAAKTKLCRGGCGFELGASNPRDVCSVCEKK